MTFEHLSEVNRSRCESPTGFGHSLASWRPSQWSNAMAGECGEVCNLTKKIDRLLDHARGNKPEDQDRDKVIAKLIHEIGDVVIYADLLAQRIGVNLKDCVSVAFNAKSLELNCQQFYLNGER